jgi:dihydrofolate reductase
MVMAMDRNKLVGRQGTLPWKISSDLKYFKQLTMGKPMLMGRVTFESLGGVLPGRPHIVITRDADWTHPNVEVVHTLDDGIEAARRYDQEELMIIGGASICAQAMPTTDRLYLTVIDHEFDGDRWLCSFDWQHWKTISQQEVDETGQGGYRFTYYVLEPVPAEQA